MRKISFSISLLMVCFLIQACARHGGGLSTHDIEAMKSIEVVRYKTPDLEARTTSGTVIKHALKGPLGELAGYAYGKATVSIMGGEKVLPDYGELLVRKFADRVRGEVPGWPATTVREAPVPRFFDSGGRNLMEFKISEIGVSSKHGFAVTAKVTIKNVSGDRDYSQRIKYKGASENRLHPLEAYFADGSKILMEEFAFSTDYIVTELIKSLKNQSADLSQK